MAYYPDPLSTPLPGGTLRVPLAGAVSGQTFDAVSGLPLSVVSNSPSVLTINSRDAAGNPTSVTEGGITSTYTWNADGTVATETRLGLTRTYTYSAGVLTGATVA